MSTEALIRSLSLKQTSIPVLEFPWPVSIPETSEFNFLLSSLRIESNSLDKENAFQGCIDTLGSFLIISPPMNRHHTIADVPGIKVGHASDFKALTGCTVVLCEEGVMGAIDIRGPATGTREIDALGYFHL